MYLESAVDDPNCLNICGPDIVYMRYDGDPFCVTAANVEGRWIYLERKNNNILESTEPPIVVACSD